jgi:hypothetical protein
MITYRDLEGGYTLKEGDRILMHGIEYEVQRSSRDYFMFNIGDSGRNYEVFERLDVSKEEKYSWAERFGGKACGDFPEFTSLENLTKFVGSIIEKPRYNVGDQVIIAERSGSSESYPFSFTGEMAALAWKAFTIKSVQKRIIYIEDCLNYNGDIFVYRLAEDEGCYQWHSSMFAGRVKPGSVAFRMPKGPVVEEYGEQDPFDGSMGSGGCSHDEDCESIYINTPSKPLKTTIVL